MIIQMMTEDKEKRLRYVKFNQDEGRPQKNKVVMPS